jgi:hypothetical protein
MSKHIAEKFEEFAAACEDPWMGGARGETLSFDRR